MLKLFKHKKPETGEERFIKYADAIVANSDFNGELNNKCLDILTEQGRLKPPKLLPELLAIRNEIIAEQPNNYDGTTVDLEITKRYCQNIEDNVKSHLVNNGYIDISNNTYKWILNERGKDMRRLKGHKKYQQYLDKKTKAEIAEMNGKIHWLRRAIIAAIVSAFLGYGLRYLTEPKEKISKDQSTTVEKQLSTPAAQPVKNVP